jgi:hypothetical protein
MFTLLLEKYGMVKDMYSNNKAIELLEEAVYKFPQALKSIKDNKIIEFIDNYLPYSTGFEIECNILNENIKEDIIKKVFGKIDNILDVNGADGEVRFRIPKGVKGILCLDDICTLLPHWFSLNMGSGIHYHIDMTDIYSEITDDFISNNDKWIIDELIKWETAKKLDHNAHCSRNRGWVRYANEHKTLEIRIGEMSFDYQVIIKRIIDSNRIVRQLKSKILGVETIQSLDEQLKVLKIKESSLEKLSISTFNEYKKIINSRSINLYE